MAYGFGVPELVWRYRHSIPLRHSSFTIYTKEAELVADSTGSFKTSLASMLGTVYDNPGEFTLITKPQNKSEQADVYFPDLPREVRHLGGKHP